MVKHIILWKLKKELSAQEIVQVKTGIKEGLEGLKGTIPGLVHIKVQEVGLDSSSADIMLDSSFVSEQALKEYGVHPAHVQVANSKVRPFVETRSCFDYTVEEDC